MISAILMNGHNESIKIIKSLNNFFIAEKAYDNSEGELKLMLDSAKESGALFETRFIQVFGDGLNRVLIVTKITTNTQNGISMTFKLAGFEYLLAYRYQRTQLIWSNQTAINICAGLVTSLQTGTDSAKRKFTQMNDVVLIEGATLAIPDVQMPNGVLWEFISNLMKSYEFCCDTITTGLGTAQVRFRVPVDLTNIILSDINRQSKLNIIDKDYAKVKTAVTVGGEGSGTDQSLGYVETPDTGIDRFEGYIAQSSISSNNKTIPNTQYTNMLDALAETQIKPPELDADYIIDTSLARRVKTGDTIYISSLLIDKGHIKPKKITELKTDINNGVRNDSITLE